MNHTLYRDEPTVKEQSANSDRLVRTKSKQINISDKEDISGVLKQK